MATMGASDGLIFSCSDIARACRVKDFRVYIGEALNPDGPASEPRHGSTTV